MSVRAHVSHRREPAQFLAERERRGLIDKAILLAVAEESFSSFRRIASKTLTSRTAVYPHLVGSLGMTVKYLRWVPHRLSPQQNGSRVQEAQTFPAVLKSTKVRSWHDITTLDWPFFYVYTDFEENWLLRDKVIETRERQMISCEDRW
jgi:hypothetical protein